MTSWTRTDHGLIALLTFTRPPANWMSTAAMTELQGELERVADDGDIALVLLTGGVDGYFVAHADLDDLALYAAGKTPGGDPHAWVTVMRLLETMPQPTVAAIDGQAWGGGFELALACTMRVGSERAHVGLPEVSVGILPGAGGTQRLPRLIGTAKAAELILGATILQADEALAAGVLNAVLPTDGFVDAALAWCERITRHPSRAVSLAKQAIVEGSRLDLDDGLGLETRLFNELNTSDDAKTRNAAITRPS